MCSVKHKGGRALWGTVIPVYTVCSYSLLSVAHVQELSTAIQKMDESNAWGLDAEVRVM